MNGRCGQRKEYQKRAFFLLKDARKFDYAWSWKPKYSQKAAFEIQSRQKNLSPFFLL